MVFLFFIKGGLDCLESDSELNYATFAVQNQNGSCPVCPPCKLGVNTYGHSAVNGITGVTGVRRVLVLLDWDQRLIAIYTKTSSITIRVHSLPPYTQRTRHQTTQLSATAHRPRARNYDSNLGFCSETCLKISISVGFSVSCQKTQV